VSLRAPHVGVHGPTAGCTALCCASCTRCASRDRALYWCRLVASASSRGLTSQHFSAAPASRSRGSAVVISALLPFYASPCSAAFRWWRIALAPGFVEPLCRIASMPHARSPATHGFSASLSQTRCVSTRGFAWEISHPALVLADRHAWPNRICVPCMIRPGVDVLSNLRPFVVKAGGKTCQKRATL
jgi:hypothetical protein